MKEIEQYKIACNNVASQFLEKYFNVEVMSWLDEFDQRDPSGKYCVACIEQNDYVNYRWVDHGAFMEIADYCISLSTMIDALTLDAPVKSFFDYYELELDLAMRNKKPEYNFKNYIKYIVNKKK